MTPAQPRPKSSPSHSPRISSAEEPAGDSSSAILASIDTPSLTIFSKMPNIGIDQDLVSLDLPHQNDSSFLLIDGKEHLKVSTSDQFVSRLGCARDSLVKVVSIFGNSGDGKSHTLNHLFFEGREVFPESARQDPCTLGVRAAFSPEEQILCLDTEGLLLATSPDHQRTRLLLKILAVSDVVLFRSRAERLHRDLFTFLGSASKAYHKHFADVLYQMDKNSSGAEPSSKDSVCSLGPAVIIFHETLHTDPLQPSVSENNSPEEQLRKHFNQLGLDLNAFASLRYVGVRSGEGATNFSSLKAAVQQEVASTLVRSARPPRLVLAALCALNNKFSGRLEQNATLLPPEFFSCSCSCASCGVRCEKSMGHVRDNQPHFCTSVCTFQNNLHNCEYICVACLSDGHRQVVIPKMATASDQTSWLGIAKYAWSGYVLECSRCGVIYRSRQFWYGNKDPTSETTVVQAEVCHVWGGSPVGSTGHNTARRLLDGVTQLSETVAGMSKAPSVAVSSWFADKIAPKYWRPNSEISHCYTCNNPFQLDSAKHHCRACGEGFCDACSAFSRPVPERGWGDAPVRVCKICKDLCSSGNQYLDDTEEVRVRKYGEVMLNTLTNVASVLDYPKDFIKNSAQPEYWVPDSEIKECSVCQTPLPTAKLKTHHCRDCGLGVCQNCSSRKRPVPNRGWDTPVRVCDSCLKRD